MVAPGATGPQQPTNALETGLAAEDPQVGVEWTTEASGCHKAETPLERFTD